MSARTITRILAVAALAIAGVAARAQNLSATVDIDASKVENTISPNLYGQFTEFMFEDIKGGLWAELLLNRSFEEPADARGLTRYWEREPDDRNDDPAMKFSWDASVSYPPGKKSENGGAQHSMRVTIAYEDNWLRGVRQSRIPVRAGIAYHGYFWAKSEGFTGKVTAQLGQDQTGGEVYASADSTITSADWKQYEFTLTSTKSDPLAKFALHFYGKGKLWIDEVSLMPGDAVGGVRKDVYDRIAALKPAFIRWPGGNVAQDYHWQWAIGPREQRTTWTNLSWWNEPEPSDFGTDEYLGLCRELRALPSITVNVEGRGATSEEAAGWVQYVNGSASSKYGGMRVANGHSEPYAVKLWEVGNEIWGDWVRGHSDAATYARNFNRYAKAMRAQDANIKLVAVGDNDLEWDRTVLTQSGKDVDYLAVHHYYGSAEMKGDIRNLLAHPLHYERFYDQLRRMIPQAAPGRDIKLVINEWNTSLPLPQQHSMLSALYAARMMNVFERSGDIVEMTAVSDLVNGWIGGIIQAGRHGVFVTPTYWVNKLYRDHLGAERLAANVSSPMFDAPLEGQQVPYLDVTATRSADRTKIYLHLVNTNTEKSMDIAFRLRSTEVDPQAQLDVLNGASLDAGNTFEKPEAVRVTSSQIRVGEQFRLVLPAHSVNVITLSKHP
jgi:alpha-N-arabinofuranosidase